MRFNISTTRPGFPLLPGHWSLKKVISIQATYYPWWTKSCMYWHSPVYFLTFPAFKFHIQFLEWRVVLAITGRLWHKKSIKKLKNVTNSNPFAVQGCQSLRHKVTITYT